MTPYDAHYGFKPNLSRLRIFGSRLCCKLHERRHSKLDLHVNDGISLGYGATNKHIFVTSTLTTTEKRLQLMQSLMKRITLLLIDPPEPHLLYDIDYQTIESIIDTTSNITQLLLFSHYPPLPTP